MSTAAVVEQILAARESGTRLRVAGAGTWLHAGRPVSAGATLSLADDSGIVEYVPGDLTLTARAGTRLAGIEAATLAHGQWLPLAPWGGSDGTVGATLSTATAGPFRNALGEPRDVVLGMEFVTGAGEVVRSGGRVVKNVAGFDLTRLITGSWGTLGVITEVTVRLRARPAVARTVALHVPAAMLGELPGRLRALPFTPIAAELLNAPLARHAGLVAHDTLLLELGGNARALAAQLDLLAGMGRLLDADPGMWTRLRTCDRNARAVWRCSHLASEFGKTWAAAPGSASGSEPFVHGAPARGVVRVVVPAQTADAADMVPPDFHGSVNVEHVPADAWLRVAGSEPHAEVAAALRQRFDPSGILNVGIMGSAA